MKKLVVLSCLTLLASTATAQEDVPDVRKLRVEGPVKDALRSTPRPVRGTAQVTWHADVDAAKAAAAKSRKPILLFQLLGKLDDEFC